MGMVHSRAKKQIFDHNNLADLEKCLINSIENKNTPCIVFESVYSMDGTVSKMSEIFDLADKYGAITYLDEVHSTGIYGETGAGKLEELGLQDRVDIINSTLGKSLGCQGGYIAANSIVIDAIRSIADGFIFSTSLSPVIVAGALAALKYLKDHNELRIQIHERAKKLKYHMKKAGIPVMDNDTHIVPVLIGDAKKAKEISDILLNDYDIYCQAIQSPTVPEGTERLRFAPTPNHTDAMIDDLITALRDVLYR
jgi:5-aminolevulinate synthase